MSTWRREWAKLSPECARIMAAWEREQEERERERCERLIAEREAAAERLRWHQQADPESLLERQLRRRFALEMGRQFLRPKR